MVKKIKINLEDVRVEQAKECTVIAYDETKVNKLLTKNIDSVNISDGRVEIELDVNLDYNIGWVNVWLLDYYDKWSRYGSMPLFLMDKNEEVVAIVNNKNYITDFKNENMSNSNSSASEDLIQNRLKICEQCEFWNASGFNGSGRCEKCGCSTQAKLKAVDSKCPLDPPKW